MISQDPKDPDALDPESDKGEDALDPAADIAAELPGEPGDPDGQPT